ncbi:hypothetical protein JD969_06415 [Planctomycetota bacterium]|nr:hypothetical protein JD969_06415 [Planctomycetota bacterium]
MNLKTKITGALISISTFILMFAIILVGGVLAGIYIENTNTQPPYSDIIAALPFIVSLGIGLLVLRYRHSLRPKHALAWKCSKCSHTLVGLFEPRCPECGTYLTQTQIQNAPPGLFNFDSNQPPSITP